MDPGDKYIGVKDLKNRNRLRQHRDLYGGKLDTNGTSSRHNTVMQHIRDDLKPTVDGFATKRYHIIRTLGTSKGEQTIDNFRQVFSPDEYDYVEFDMKNKSVSELNAMLKKSPQKHTLIFIKEYLRCSKTLVKTHLGVLYELYTTSVKHSTISQGLLGRLCGYDDNGDSICYTNIPTVDLYEQLWEARFEDTDLERKWTNGMRQKTFNGKAVILDSDSDDESVDGEPINFPVIQFEKFDEMKRFVNERFKLNESGKKHTVKFNKRKSTGFVGFKLNGKDVHKRMILNEDTPCKTKELMEFLTTNHFGFGLTDSNYRWYIGYNNTNDSNLSICCIAI